MRIRCARMRALLTLTCVLLVAGTAGCGDDEDNAPAVTLDAERVYSAAFRSAGASDAEIDCGIEALVEGVGVDRLDSAAAELKSGEPHPIRELFPQIAEASDECDIESAPQASVPDRCLEGSVEEIIRKQDQKACRLRAPE
jgi:hypothetical protein